MPGTEFSIAHGPYSAVINARGGALRRLQYAGRDLVVSFGAEGGIPDFRGVICAPWPNRLADGTYTYAGRSYSTVLNEPERGAALHGFTTDRVWEMRQASEIQWSWVAASSQARNIPGCWTFRSPTTSRRMD